MDELKQRLSRVGELWDKLIQVADQDVTNLEESIRLLSQPNWLEAEIDKLLGGEMEYKPTEEECVKLRESKETLVKARAEAIEKLTPKLEESRRYAAAVRVMAVTGARTKGAVN